MVNKNNKAGIHTAIFALKTILHNTEEDQVIMSPRRFGKIVKGISLYDKRTTLPRSELLVYQNQLINALRVWSEDGDSNWIAREGNGSRFFIVFERIDKRES